MQQSHRTPTTKLAYSAALEELETKWFKHCLDQRSALRKAFKEHEDWCFKGIEEEHTRRFNLIEDQVKRFPDQRTRLLKLLDNYRRLHEKQTELLVQQNCDLLVGSSLLRLSTGFLIFQ